MAIEERLKEIVATQLGIEVDQIRRESRFIEDLGADTLDFVELLMGTEEWYEICIPECDAEAITTFGKLVEYVETAL